MSKVFCFTEQLNCQIKLHIVGPRYQVKVYFTFVMKEGKPRNFDTSMSTILKKEQHRSNTYHEDAT